jgi:hypothetical protein
MILSVLVLRAEGKSANQWKPELILAVPPMVYLGSTATSREVGGEAGSSL